MGLLWIGITIVSASLFSCKKFLDKKPKDSLAVPNSLKDLEALLNSPDYNAASPLLELVADNFYVTDAAWNNGEDESKRYAWLDGLNYVQEPADWNSKYRTIGMTNVVLDQLKKIDAGQSEIARYNTIKGVALFGRALQFYMLAQLYCRPFSATASTDPGIVIRLTPSVDGNTTRSTVAQTYAQIIQDLKEAAELVPEQTPFTTWPNKAAAYGMLSRVYLSMRDYENALLYANKSLEKNNVLLNYNSLNTTGTFELPVNFLSNPEIDFVSITGSLLMQYPKSIVDSTLYRSYSADDIRKTIFFGAYGNDKFYFKGSYYERNNFNTPVFFGIATDEIYLNRAECHARLQNKDAALADLNLLLRNRYKTGTYTDINTGDAQQALQIILQERRKELLFRGLRWTDLRRLNLENGNIELARMINGTRFTLPPNDLRWVLLIPAYEIRRSGIPQNPR